ncbi:unnamed protein product [Sphagnum jensenii]|uniref:Phosphatidic acid phosphatase type 2/haloperoxidase domain-containing protein n=1 Tax=Sphagnum jensenii TaxID=128206 RepID=A0ABP0VWX3_9BRYO
MLHWPRKCLLFLICTFGALCIMASVALAVQPAAHDASARQEGKMVHSHHGLVKENCCIHGYCDCNKISPGYAGGQLVPIKVVHIRYKAGDKLGYFLGIMTLVPIFIALGSIPTIVLFWRDLPTSFFAVGLVLSEGLNQIMKQIVKQPRPYTCKALDSCDTFGWPSSHSQFSCFFSVYMALLAFYHLQFSEPFLRVVVIALVCLFAPTVMYSRVYLGYHTVGQVYAGAAVGITLGCLWYRIVNSVIARHFVTLEKSAFCRRFLISYNKSSKDLISSPSKDTKGGEKKSTKEGKQIGKVRKLGRPLKRVNRAF